MTKLFFRVKRNGRWVDVEIEHLTPEERRVMLATNTPEQRHRALDHVCTTLVDAELKLRACDLIDIP